MACLRELNNNKSYSAQASSIGLSKKDTDDKITPKLIVEFSLENMQKVKVLKEREERQAQKRDPTANGDNDEDSADDDNVGGRGEDPNDYEGEESTAASRVGNKRAAPSGNNDDSDSDGDSDGESDGEDEGEGGRVGGATEVSTLGITKLSPGLGTLVEGFSED